MGFRIARYSRVLALALMLLPVSALAYSPPPNCTTSGYGLNYATATNSYGCVNLAGSGGVSSFSGDGSLLSNSASTGAVTATLANAPANTVWGNNTSGSAAPGYQTMVMAQLPAFAQAMTASVAMLSYGGL